MKRIVALISLGAVLSGCTSVAVQDPLLTSAVSPTHAASSPPISSEVSPEFAVARLPASTGRVIAVRQVARDKFLQQAIVYENATSLEGENLLTVEFSGEGVQSFTRAPTRQQILKEMHDALPGVSMQVGATVGDNSQGAFGYATGALGGKGSCIYAWQQVKNPAGDGAMAGSIVSDSYPAQVRLRYCTPSVSQERILSLMSGLRLKGVSDDTIRTLQFAGGPSATPARTPLQTSEAAAMVPVREQTLRQPAVRRTAARTVRQAAEPVETATAENPKTAPAIIANPVKVPMPGTDTAVATQPVAVIQQSAAATPVATGTSVVAKAASGVTPIRKAVTVPMPGADTGADAQ